MAELDALRITALDPRFDGLRRMAALRTLSREGVPADLLPLTALLREPDPGIVALTALTLAAILERSQEKHPEVLRVTTDALELARPWESRRFDPILEKMLTDDELAAQAEAQSPSVRSTCARVAARRWTAGLAMPKNVARGLSDEDVGVRRICAEAAGRHAPLLPLDREILPAIEDSDAITRVWMAVARRSPEELEAWLQSEHEALRSVAGWGLGSTGRLLGLADPVPLVRRATLEGWVAAGRTERDERLLRAFDDEDARVRVGAVVASSRWSFEDAETILQRAVADPDLRVRVRAEQTLSTFGSAATSLVRILLSSARRHERELAARVIGSGSFPGLVESLSLLLSDGAPTVRSAAADALGKLEFPRLIDALSASQPATRSAAARGLRGPLGLRAASELARAIADPDAIVAGAATQALAAHGDARFFDKVVDALTRHGPSCASSVLECFQPSFESALDVAKRLPRFGAPLLARFDRLDVIEELAVFDSSTTFVEAFVAWAQRHSERREEIARTADRILRFRANAPEVVQRDRVGLVASMLVELFATDEAVSGVVRESLRSATERPRAPSAAFVALGWHGNQEDRNYLLELVRAGDVKVAGLAALGIAVFAENVWTRLLEIAGDPELAPERRAFAVQGLARVLRPEITEALILLAEASPPILRAAALRALKRRDDPRIRTVAVVALENPKPEVQAAAADALSMFVCSPTELAALSVPLLAGEPEVRAEAARALAWTVDPASLPALAAAVDDPDPEVRRDATEGLVMLSIPVGLEVERPLVW